MQAVQPAPRHGAASGTARWHARCETVGSVDRVRWHGAARLQPRVACSHWTAAHQTELPATALEAQVLLPSPARQALQAGAQAVAAGRRPEALDALERS